MNLLQKYFKNSNYYQIGGNDSSLILKPRTIIYIILFIILIYIIYRYIAHIKIKPTIQDLSGNIIIQPTSLLITIGIESQKSSLGNFIANTTTKHCEEYKKSDNALKNIQNFVNNYKIKPNSIVGCENISDNDSIQCWKKFNTPNDFFIRQRVGLPKTPIEDSLVSPADCYCIYFEDIENSNVWIKGTGFTPQKLMFGSNNDINLDNYSLFIFRLAPHHYHRYHCPVNGRIIKINKYGENKYSVDPKIVNSKIDVYSQNVHLVIQIELVDKKIAYLAVIGATCVASIEITHKNIVNAFHKNYNTNVKLTDEEIVKRNNVINLDESNVLIQNNEELGNFQYGGSTLVLIYPNENSELTEIGNIIKKNSSNLTETEIKVGMPLYL